MTKAKILVVDDDEAIRNSLRNAFISEGFEVTTANDGVEGLASAFNEKPQLILTDIKMPKLDGMGMLKELRKSGDWGSKVPVIILTNFDTDEKTMQDIVENDPSFYFLKSKINPSTIIDIIKEKLGTNIYNA